MPIDYSTELTIIAASLVAIAISSFLSMIFVGCQQEAGWAIVRELNRLRKTFKPKKIKVKIKGDVCG